MIVVGIRIQANLAGVVFSPDEKNVRPVSCQPAFSFQHPLECSDSRMEQ